MDIQRCMYKQANARFLDIFSEGSKTKTKAFTNEELLFAADKLLSVVSINYTINKNVTDL